MGALSEALLGGEMVHETLTTATEHNSDFHDRRQDDRDRHADDREAREETTVIPVMPPVETISQTRILSEVTCEARR